jgi:DNA-binding transcriptional ArsR family regulator
MDLPLSGHLDSDAIETLRERVKKLYGNRHRLEVAVAIGRAGETFYNHELGAVTGIPDSTVRAVLLDLVEAGLVRDLKGKRGLPKFYERVSSDYWAACELVLVELDRLAVQKSRVAATS